MIAVKADIEPIFYPIFLQLLEENISVQVLNVSQIKTILSVNSGTDNGINNNIGNNINNNISNNINNSIDHSADSSNYIAERLWITDDSAVFDVLKRQNEACLIYLHENNRDQSFNGALYGMENPDEIELDYLEKVFRRHRTIPWDILDTERCCIRETMVEDVPMFYEIYKDESITQFTEGLLPERKQEEQYIVDYIEKVYGYYEFGIWTVLWKDTGEIIGRAGLCMREGFEYPEIGFLIAPDWQNKGIAMEVCQAILEYGCTVHDFEKIQAFIHVENRKSAHLCEKLGFQNTDKVMNLMGLDGQFQYWLKE